MRVEVAVLGVHPNESHGFRGRKAILNHADALVSACPSHVNRHSRTLSNTGRGRRRRRQTTRVQERCESRGGRPGLPSLISLIVSVDVKQHSVTDRIQFLHTIIIARRAPAPIGFSCFHHSGEKQWNRYCASTLKVETKRVCVWEGGRGGGKGSGGRKGGGKWG